MQAMKLPRFTLRTLFVTIAIFAVCFVLDRPRWRRGELSIYRDAYWANRQKLDQAAASKILTPDEYVSARMKLDDDWRKIYPNVRPGEFWLRY